MCTINIASIRRIVSGGLSKIEIRGQLSNCTCSRIAVGLIGCQNMASGGQPTVSVTPDASGNFKVEFDLASPGVSPLECGCNEDVTFAVSCLDSNGNPVNQQVFTLKLDCSPPKPTCPGLKLISVTPKNCVNGKREVEVEVEVDNQTAAVAVLQWYFDTNAGAGGTPGTAIVANPGTTQTYTAKYTFTADDKDHEITVRHLSPTGCTDLTTRVKVAKCPPPCPTISPGSLKILSAKCNSNCKVDVEVEAELNQGSVSDIEYQWKIGGVFSPVQKLTFSGPKEKVKFTFRDLIGDGSKQEVELVFQKPANCPGAKTEVTLPVCQGCCPSVSLSTVVDKNCTSAGKRKVTLSLKGSVPAGKTAEIGASDITDPAKPIDLGKKGSLTGNFSFSLPAKEFSPGTYRVKVVIHSPTGCPINTFTEFTVDPCPGTFQCPEVKIELNEGDCNGDKRKATVKATVKLKSPGLFTGKLLDVTDPAKPITLAEKKSQTADFVLEKQVEHTAGSTRKFKVELTGPETCPPTEKSFTLSACTPTKPPSNPPTVTTPNPACIISRVAGMLLLGIGIFLFLLILCVPAGAVGLAIAGAVAVGAGIILILLYGFLCKDKRCNWFLLILAQTLLITGSVLSFFNGCCNTGGFGLGMGGLLIFLLGLGLFWIWTATCNPQPCTTLLEMMFVLGGVLAFMAAIVPFFKVINICFTILPGVITVGVLVFVVAVNGIFCSIQRP